MNDLVVVPEEVELLVDSSFSPQDIVVRLKQEISKMYKYFFFFSSIQKVKYYCLDYEKIIFNINRFVLHHLDSLLNHILSTPLKTCINKFRRDFISYTFSSIIQRYFSRCSTSKKGIKNRITLFWSPKNEWFDKFFRECRRMFKILIWNKFIRVV